MNTLPKFVVSEEVIATYHRRPAIKTEIVKKKFFTKFIFNKGTADEEKLSNVWLYKTTECVVLDAKEGKSTYWVQEHQLSKLPPEERISWADCEFNPNKIEEKT